MSGPDDDDAGLGVIQRTVHASDASPLFTPAASSVFNWRGAGEPPATGDTVTPEEEPDPPPPPRTQEKPTMATRTRKNTPRKGSGSPQLQICSVLLQNGDQSAEQIAQALPQFDAKQIKSAVNNAITNERVTNKGEGYHLTAVGKAWVQASTPAEEPEPEKPARGAAGRKTAKKKRAQREPASEVDTSTAGQDEASFRCGVMSDGCFFITKEGVSIELDAGEHAQMLHYLERMAVAA